MHDVSVSCCRTRKLKSHEPDEKTTHQKYTPDYAAPVAQHPHLLLSDLALDVVVLRFRLDHAITAKTDASSLNSPRRHIYTVLSRHLLRARLQNISSRATMEK